MRKPVAAPPPLPKAPHVALLTPAFDRWSAADDLNLAWMSQASARRRAEETL